MVRDRKVIKVNLSDQLDPDRLKLSKKEILGFCNRVLAEWKKNPKENWQYLIAMQLMKTGISATPENVLIEIWRKILSWFNILLYENSIEIMREQGDKWYELYDAIKKDALKKEND